MERRMFLSVVLFVMMLVAPSGAAGALSSQSRPPTADQSGSVAPPSSQAVTPPAPTGQVQTAATPYGEAGTEGGFVFYDRRTITSTLGRSRQVLLTFDDGPHPENTPKILDTLKRMNLKAIFFVVGTNVRKYPEIVRRIVAEGHTIGNHTFYHANLQHCAAERITREIRDTNELIRQITGVTPTVFRPPYGALSPRALEILRQENMSVMLWSVDPGDWRNRSMSRTIANLQRQLDFSHGGRGGVVLMHDTLPSSASALEPFLLALAHEGLLATQFAGHVPAAGTRRYWTTQEPRLARWQETAPRWKPETLGRAVLVALLKSQPAPKPNAIALLRAKKTGELYRTMLCRAL